MVDRYIGLMSGTSVDAVDVAIVEFVENKPKVTHVLNWPIPNPIRQAILRLCMPGEGEIDLLGSVDVQIGELFAEAVNALLERANLTSTDIRAIGSHGQTIRHRPSQANPFTLQIGNPAIIAHRTGITTIADFRRADIAVGGQGAPLVPAFHQTVFRSNERERVIVNIGGMANLTRIPVNQNEGVLGYDTGPGNVLINAWIERHKNEFFDRNGAWAAAGSIKENWLNQLLADPYFELPPPKSTGREHFNIDWVDRKIAESGLSMSATDIQSTLTELTARSIANAIRVSAPKSQEIFICGGGAHNEFLMRRLRHHLAHRTVDTTNVVGIDPDFVEAATFAWLARQTAEGLPGNLPSVTGARRPVILGAIYPV